MSKMIENIAKLRLQRNPFNEVFAKLCWIIKTIINSHKLNATFVVKSLTKKLLNPIATRFATNYIMVERAQELRHALREIFMDDHGYN
jgi:hypothetical protein